MRGLKITPSSIVGLGARAVYIKQNQNQKCKKIHKINQNPTKLTKTIKYTWQYLKQDRICEYSLIFIGMNKLLSAITLTTAALGANAQAPNRVDVPFDSGYVFAQNSEQYGSGIGVGMVLWGTQHAVGLSLTHLQKADFFNLHGATNLMPGVQGIAWIRTTRANASAVFGNPVFDKKVTAWEWSIGLNLEWVWLVNSFGVEAFRQKWTSRSDIGSESTLRTGSHTERVSWATNFYEDTYQDTTTYSAIWKKQDWVRTHLNLNVGTYANLFAGYEKVGKQRTLNAWPEIYGDGWNLTAKLNQSRVVWVPNSTINTLALWWTQRINRDVQLALGAEFDKEVKLKGAFARINMVTDQVGVSGKPTKREQMWADYVVLNKSGKNLENVRPLFDLKEQQTTKFISSILVWTEKDQTPEIKKPTPEKPIDGIDSPATVTLDATNITTTSLLAKCGITDADGATGTCTLKKSDGTVVSSWSIGADKSITGLTPDTTYILMINGTAKDGKTKANTPVSQNKNVKTLAETVPPADPAPVSAPIGTITVGDNLGNTPIEVNFPVVSDTLNRTVTCIFAWLPPGVTQTSNNTVSGIYDAFGTQTFSITRECDSGTVGNKLIQNWILTVNDEG